MAEPVMKHTERELTSMKLMDTLAEIGGKLTAEEDVIFKGTKLILPETMTLAEAINFLRQKRSEDDQNMDFSRSYNYRPWDGARATMLALHRAFGAVHQKGTPGWFGEDPPRLITIPSSATDTEQVPWGGIAVGPLPGVSFFLGSSRDDDYGEVFHITASGPRKFRFHIEGIFRLIEEELKTNSLYRGKAFDGQKMPKFLDLSGVNENKVIYSDDTQQQLEANVWSLLRYPEALAQLGVPLKRAVLLEGPYGTGKTLAAMLTAKCAVENGWSFIMCRPGQDNLFNVMATARLYQPAVVFFEDIDILAEGSRDHISTLLDIVDGLQAKNTRIMCVLTTNHADRIHKGLVRPGRLDAIIHIGALDASGIRRLIEQTVPHDLLSPEITWSVVTDSMDGYLPAFCREVIDRAVRYNVARNKGVATMLDTQDFVAAAHGLRPQLKLMEEAPEGKKAEAVAAALSQVVTDVVEVTLAGATLRDHDGDTLFTFHPNVGNNQHHR